MSSENTPPPGPPPLPNSSSSDESFKSQEDGLNYEIMWDCEYCDAKKLLGLTHRYCPQCGAAQNPEKRYFPPEGEEVLAVNHQFVGADKNCAACDTPNSTSTTYCVSCGSPMDGSPKVNTLNEKEESKAPPPRPTTVTGTFPKIKWILIGVAAFVLLIIGLMMIKEERVVTVAGHSWERSIEVEVFASVSDEAWEDDVPLKAYDQTCTQKEKDTKKVEDGQDCHDENVDNGDGTYKKVEKCETKYKEVPVYDDWCLYKIDKWTSGRTEKSAGSDLSPAWPTPTLRTCPGPRLGCEREGSRPEKYTVAFKDDAGDPHECEYDYNKWKEIAKNTEWSMQFTKLTGGIVCEFDFVK